MIGNVTYHQQISYCGKPQCRKCREGIGHGPYWYAYRTENGRTTRTYVGKNLPPELQPTQEPLHEPIPTEHDLVTVRIRILGQFSLERKHEHHWQAVADSTWQHQRVRVLLACLLSSPGRKMGREQIMDALWPDADMETASNRLDRAVHSLRQILDPSLNRPALSQMLRIEREGLILADQTQVWVDADAFENLLTQAHTTDDVGNAETLLEEAAALYSGDFLPEERLSEWAIPRREALQRGWLGLLLELADLRIARTAFSHAIEPLDRLLAADPTNEAAVQRLILSLAQLDRRGEALRAYHRFTAALKRDHSIAPLPETRDLYEAVQHGETHISITLPFQNPQYQKATASGESDVSARQFYTVQIGRTHQSPLIGRDSELATMQQLLLTTEQEARSPLPGGKKITSRPQERQRYPQCALLVGEAGIGKTRLAEELSQQAQKRGWSVAWSRVYAQESGVPYRQWTEVLRSVIAHGHWQRQEVGKRPVVFQPLCTLLPELQDVLPSVVFPIPLSPEQEQLRLWEATLELLTTISERTPLLIVLDDFHWADASSSELFAYLVRRLHGRPIAIVGTYRDNELPATNPLRALLTDLQREQAITHLSIQPLTDEQISSLISHRPHLPEMVVQYIQTRAAGNPFFAEELARSLETQVDAPAPPPSEQADAAHPLPDTIAAVLELRMNRLGSQCQRMLSNAAVLGGSFTFQVICQMETGGNINEDATLDQVEEALQAGVLTEEGAGTRITYHFWHPLLVSYLYEQLSAGRRARLHRRAAEVLPLVYQGHEEEQAATIVNHLVEGGGDPHHVIHYAELAGDRAYNLSAYPEAERYYHIAVNQFEEQLGSPPTEPTETREHLSYLLERLGECLRVQGKGAEARRAYERILELRKVQSRQHQFASDAEQKYEAQIDAILWREISLTWYDTGDTTHAQQCCERGEQVLHDAGVDGGPAWAILRFQQSYIYWSEGNYDAAHQMAQKAQRLFEDALHQQDHPISMGMHMTATRGTLAGDPINLGRTHRLLAAIAATIGQLTDALFHLNTALAIFEQADLQREIAHTCCNIGDIHMIKTEHESAQSFFRRSLYLAQRVGDTALMSIAFSNMGMLAARSGNVKEAETLFKQSLALAEKINDQVYICLWNAVLATALINQGKLSAARLCICRALKLSRAINNAPCISFALISLGNMHILQAKIASVEQYNVGRAENQMVLRGKQQNYNNSPTHFLMQAQKVLKYALALKELETEIRVEGQLALAEVLWLFGDIKTAQQHAIGAMEAARQHELVWIYTCTQRLLGSILAAQDQDEQAKQHFEQALQSFRTSAMHLEYARTLYSYGTALLQSKRTGQANSSKQGLDYLHEARQIFKECEAALDLQIVEHVLAAHPHPSTNNNL